MINRPLCQRAFGCALLLVAVAGCRKDDGPVAASDVSGTWEGSTSQQREIAFIVESGTVAQGSFSYTLSGDGCDGGTGGIVIQGGAAVPIQSGEFAFPRTQIGQTSFLSAEGEFTTSTSAAGTFTVEDGDSCTMTISWTATKQ